MWSIVLRYRRALLITVSMLLAYGLTVGVWLPRYLQHHLPGWVQEATQAHFFSRDVRVNPFTLKFEIDGVQLLDPQQQTLLQFDYAQINLSWASVFVLSPRFDVLQCDGLYVALTQYADGRLNWQQLQGREPADTNTAAPSSDIIKVFVRLFQLNNASVVYRDETRTPAVERAIAPLNLQLNDFSTAPDALGRYTLHAQLPDKSQWQWQGSVGVQPLRSEGEIKFEQLQLATIAPFVTSLQQFVVTDAQISSQVNYQFSLDGDVAHFTLPNVQLSVTDLTLKHRDDNDAALTGKQLRMQAELAGDEHTVTISQLHLDQFFVRATTLADGTIDWLQRTRNEIAATTEKYPSPTAWKIRINDLRLNGASAQYRDESTLSPWQADVTQLHLTATADLQVGDTFAYQLRDGDLQMADTQWRVVNDATPLTTLRALHLTPLTLNSQNKTISADTLTLKLLGSQLQRNGDGTLNVMNALHSRLPPSSDAPWTIDIATLQFDAEQTIWHDQTLSPSVVMPLSALSITVAPLAPQSARDFTAKTVLRFEQNGQAEIAVNSNWKTLATQARFDLQRFPLTPLTPYLQQHVLLRIARGDFSAKGDARYAPGKTAAAITAQLEAEVADLSLVPAAGGDPLFGVKQLRVAGIRYDSKKARVSIADIRAEQPLATVHVLADKRSNLDQLLVKKASTEAGSRSESTLTITAERFRVQNGILDFRDDSLVLPFATHVEEFGGSITGISNQPDARANIALSGKINQYGAATINGSVRAFEPLIFSDIRAQFNNVEMNPMSAYSATFAGRKIDSGRLSLDLRYQLQHGQLNGDNSITLDQFVLGDDVDSASAMWLPLDLALAILRDSEGRIQVDVPVTGDVNDPEFGYGKVVWQALVNVVSKIASAPFRALAGLFGDDSETLDALQFDAGRAQLNPPEREKLDRIGKGLQSKPALQIEVAAISDSVIDKIALASATVHRQILSDLGVPVAPTDEPSPLAFEQAKTQLALEHLAEQQWPAEKWQSYQQTMVTTARVNRALAVINSGAGDEKQYRQLLQDLIANWPVSNEALSTLATQRADNIVNHLTQVGLPVTQIRVHPVQIMDSGEQQKVRLVLTLTATRS